MSDQTGGSGYGTETRVVPLLPLRDIIVFPHMVVPLFVGREKSINALEDAMNAEKEILLSAQQKAKTNDPKPDDIFRVGTLGSIIQLLRLPDGTVKVLVEGKKRVRILRYLTNDDFFQVEVEEIPDSVQKDQEMEALMRRSSEPAMPVSRAPQATRAETPKATKKSKKGGKKDDKKDAKFSETAWFMQAVTPESLAEAEGEALSYAEQDSMTDRYRTEERLPDEVRKDFSLTMNEGEVPDEEALSKPPPNRKKKRKK